MGYTIALAGKGGTGKTTIASLLVRLIAEKKLGSILAVDADPNSNLGESLGVRIDETIGTILDDVLTHPEKIPSGMSKDRFIEYRIHTAIYETDSFDILSMGKPEGPGCYCYANNVLRNVMNKLINDYSYIIIDNEAGLEHLSRRTTRSIDALVVVSDISAVGLRSVKRIVDLAQGLDIKTKKEFLVINRYDEKIAKGKLNGLNLDYLGNIPADEKINEISLNAGSLWKLEDNAASLRALREIGEGIWRLN